MDFSKRFLCSIITMKNISLTHLCPTFGLVSLRTIILSKFTGFSEWQFLYETYLTSRKLSLNILFFDLIQSCPNLSTLSLQQWKKILQCKACFLHEGCFQQQSTVSFNFKQNGSGKLQFLC